MKSGKRKAESGNGKLAAKRFLQVRAFFSPLTRPRPTGYGGQALVLSPLRGEGILEQCYG